MSEDTVKIGIVTAEESGDLLAAEFIHALFASVSYTHLTLPTNREV